MNLLDKHTAAPRELEKKIQAKNGQVVSNLSRELKEQRLPYALCLYSDKQLLAAEYVKALADEVFRSTEQSLCTDTRLRRRDLQCKPDSLE